MTALTPFDFDYIVQLLKERSGLVLTEDKAYLLEARLTPIARRLGLASLKELVDEMRNKGSEILLSEVTEAMTINESLFFRDPPVFKAFEQHVLNYLHKARAGTRKLRIWSAAASTGQEAYSIAMTLGARPDLWSGWNIEIVGTDLCSYALKRARSGVYSQFEIQRGLPIDVLIRNFTQKDNEWEINQNHKDMVNFQVMNLLDPFTALGQFDVIFCRNVLIYFDRPTKGVILNKMRRQLAEDGTLLLGAAETVLGYTDEFQALTNLRNMFVPPSSPLLQLKTG